MAYNKYLVRGILSKARLRVDSRQRGTVANPKYGMLLSVAPPLEYNVLFVWKILSYGAIYTMLALYCLSGPVLPSYPLSYSPSLWS